MSWPALLLAAALAAGPAGPERAPVERQALVDLAYVLGEAHALRQACSGTTDQTWRARMNRLIELEKPEEGLQRRLVDAFNAGFLAAWLSGRADREALAQGIACGTISVGAVGGAGQRLDFAEVARVAAEIIKQPVHA